MDPNTREKQKDTREVWECAVSWTWLLSFIKENEDNLKHLSTQDVVTRLVIPATIKNKSRYVDLLPKACVSLPTYFASHVWSAPFLDLVESLREYIGDKPSEDVFVWIDIFAVNQHRDSGTQASDLRGLNTAVEKASKTIVCMDANAKLLTRIWCLFEIWHTFLLNVQRLAVITRNTEFDELKKIFIDCDVAKAEATVISDRDRILEEISKTMPFAEMNKNIKTALVESARIEVKRATATHGEHSIQVANSLVKFSRMLTFVGHYEEAEPFARQAMAISEKELGLEHPDTATAIHYLASLLDDLRKFRDARDLYQQCLAIKEKIYGSEHPSIVKTLHNLATVLSSTGELDESLRLYQRCIAMQEKLVGSEHADTATILCGYGAFLRETGNYEESERVFQKALGIQERILSPEHPSIADTIGNIASLFLYTGKREESLLYYQRALAIYEKVLGEHPSTAFVLQKCGNEMQLSGKYEEAITYYQRAYDIRLKLFGSEHIDTSWARDSLETCKNILENPKVEALDMNEMYIGEKWDEEDDSNFVSLMTRLMAQTEEGNTDDAKVEADSNNDDVVNREDVNANLDDDASAYSDELAKKFGWR